MKPRLTEQRRRDWSFWLAMILIAALLFPYLWSRPLDTRIDQAPEERIDSSAPAISASDDADANDEADAIRVLDSPSSRVPSQNPEAESNEPQSPSQRALVDLEKLLDKR